MKKIKLIIFIIIVSHLSAGQAWKSLLLPGWGENSIGYKKTGNSFMYAEAGIWLSFILTNEFKSSYFNTSRNYAIEYADVNWSGKNDIFASHVGNYDSTDEYNNMYTWSTGNESPYSNNPEYYWNWCSEGINGDGSCISNADDDKRRKYDNWRYKSRNYEEIRDLSVAALIINRVISLFNVLRLQNSDKISSEFKQYDENEFNLKIFYHF